MEIPAPGDIAAEVLRLTDEPTVDLIVHLPDVDRVRAAIDKRPDRFQFRVVQSEHLSPGKMIVVDKSDLLRRRNSISGSVAGTVIQSGDIIGGPHL